MFDLNEMGSVRRHSTQMSSGICADAKVRHVAGPVTRRSLKPSAVAACQWAPLVGIIPSLPESGKSRTDPPLSPGVACAGPRRFPVQRAGSNRDLALFPVAPNEVGAGSTVTTGQTRKSPILVPPPAIPDLAGKRGGNPRFPGPMNSAGNGNRGPDWPQIGNSGMPLCVSTLSMHDPQWAGCCLRSLKCRFRSHTKIPRPRCRTTRLRRSSAHDISATGTEAEPLAGSDFRYLVVTLRTRGRQMRALTSQQHVPSLGPSVNRSRMLPVRA
jgi:hypothetical protein